MCRYNEWTECQELSLFGNIFLGDAEKVTSINFADVDAGNREWRNRREKKFFYRVLLKSELFSGIMKIVHTFVQ